MFTLDSYDVWDVWPAATRVLMALIRVYARDGRATVRSVAAEVDLGASTTLAHLRRLRRFGLVDWADGQTGTLRPLVGPVLFLGDWPCPVCHDEFPRDHHVCMRDWIEATSAR
jgi:hypothetical protein